MQTYMDAAFKPDDTIAEKVTKLYLGIISLGEQVYSAGSAAAELTKKLNGYDADIAEMRRKLEEIKVAIRQSGEPVL